MEGTCSIATRANCTEGLNGKHDPENWSNTGLHKTHIGQMWPSREIANSRLLFSSVL